MNDLLRTLRLLSIAANPDGGHYVGMASKRPLILEQRLLEEVRDITRQSRAEGPRAEYHTAPVLDELEMALDVPHMGRTRRERNAPAAFHNLSKAAEWAMRRISRGDEIPTD